MLSSRPSASASKQISKLKSLADCEAFLFGKVLLERLQLLTLVLNDLQQGIDSGKGLVEALQQGLVVLTVSRIHAVMDDMEVALTLEAQGDVNALLKVIQDKGEELKAIK